MQISRRQFVAQSSSLLFSAQPFLKPLAINLGSSKKILVLICLAGGNDWINTIVPYTNIEYYKARPNLAILPEAALALQDNLALHPDIAPLKKLYDQNKMSILLNVGSDSPTLSHHKAIEVLQHKDISEVSWLGRYAKLANQAWQNNLVFPAINVEPFLTNANQILISSLSSENQFTFDMDIHYRLNSAEKKSSEINLPPSKHNPFRDELERVASLIKQNHNANVYNLSLGGFDTHANQSDKHAYLLKMLATGIFSFQENLDINGLADKVLTVVYSEFGRSLAENNEKGTDHGLTNHVLVIGSKVKGGLYGSNKLQSSVPQFDLRQVYATLCDRWLGHSSESILGAKWQPIDFIIDPRLDRLG
jgi:uncharacterized protein (DUF1501 family)